MFQPVHTAAYVHSTPNGDDLVAYMARVSNPSNQNNTETSGKLIQYLIKHKHWSPFEMVSMCVEINTTRAIAAQILRHRSFSFQEFSQRYSKPTEIGTPVLPELRLQSAKNRQSSTDPIDPIVGDLLHQRVERLYEESLRVYSTLINAGVAKECARDVLPLSTPTRLFMHGTLRSWIHYCDLRCSPDTQLEHRKIAQDCLKLIEEHFPVVYSALDKIS